MDPSETAPADVTLNNPHLDRAIHRHAESTSYGELLAAEGVVTVSLDEDGEIRVHDPGA